MDEVLLLTIAVILLAAVLMLVLMRRQPAVAFGLRPLEAFAALAQQMGRAVESGHQVHVTLGRGNLSSSYGPTSVAGLEVLGYLADESGYSDTPPLVTVGEATLLPAAQAVLRHSYLEAGRAIDYPLSRVRFYADNAYPMTYAAGVSTVLGTETIGNNVAVGRFGSEVALIAEAARRHQMVQIIGTDNPTAMAVATAYTDNLLWGEELFAASAYLKGTPVQKASLRAQDVLRWLVAGLILLVALLRFAGFF